MTTREELTRRTGLKFIIPEIQPRLILSIEGQEFTGKTHLALTAPGPIAYFSTDFGEEGVLQKLVEGGEKDVAPYLVSYQAPDLDKRKQWQDYAKEGEILMREVWRPFEETYFKAMEAGFRTVILDTASEFWDLLRLCHFGKLAQNPEQTYGAVNAQFKELLRAPIKTSGVNLILIHQQEEEREDYVDAQGKTKSRVVKDAWKRRGFKHMGYVVQAYCTCRRIDPKRSRLTKLPETEGASFTVEVYKSRHNPDSVGVVLEMPTFAELAMVLSPNVSPEHWF